MTVIKDTQPIIEASSIRFTQEEVQILHPYEEWILRERIGCIRITVVVLNGNGGRRWCA